MRTITQSHSPLRNPEDGSGGGGGQYVPADITPGQEQPQQSPLNQRFSELTGTIKEQKEAMARQEALIQQLMATQAQVLAQVNQRPQEAQPAPIPLTVEIPEGMDPATAQFFQKLTGTFQQQLEAANKRTEQLVHQATAGVRMTTAQLEMQQALANQPFQVAELAQRLYQQWNANGYTGWKPSDAVVFARGQLGVAGNSPPPRTNPQDAYVPGGAPPPDVRQVNPALPPELPPEVLSKMSLSQEEAYWRKRLEAQGGVDQPILLR